MNKLSFSVKLNGIITDLYMPVETHTATFTIPWKHSCFFNEWEGSRRTRVPVLHSNKLREAILTDDLKIFRSHPQRDTQRDNREHGWEFACAALGGEADNVVVVSSRRGQLQQQPELQPLLSVE